MNTSIRQKKSSRKYDKLIEAIVKKIEEADKIVVGAGAGLSASAGLDYNDMAFFEDMYKPFLKKKYETIAQGISDNWHLNRDNATKFWGFWAHHINNVYYRQDQLSVYKSLYEIIKDKDYFVITTNADGQFFKGGFDRKKVFATQGNYGKFQCQHGCHDEIYDNREMVERMLEGFDSESLEIREEDIPVCSRCGDLMCPNLRIDQYFIEKHHMHNQDDYVDFVSINDEKIVFLELGVGFNTPVIIRFPFEEMTKTYENATLIRINKTMPGVFKVNKDKAITTDIDIKIILESILGMMESK